MLLATLLTIAAGQDAKTPPHAAPTIVAPQSVADEENGPRLMTAQQLLRDRQPQDALAIADVAIASYERAAVGTGKRVYCGMSPTETLLYMAMAAKDHVDAVAVSPGYCNALYLRGFALIDLGRTAEARATYDSIVAMAPMHAQFLNEYGQLYRIAKDWPAMIATCTRAYDAAGLGLPEGKVPQQGAALRCQGYALVEQGKWDEATQRYRQALALDPKDAKAQGELRYIAEHRGAAKP